MGSIIKHATIKGKTLNLAFSELQANDEEEYGTDIYSGGWNNATGVREISSQEFDRRVKEDDISKHMDAVAKCILKPIENSNKIKTDVTRYPNHGTRKWKTVYVAETTAGERLYPKIEEEKQADAITKARAYVEKNPNTTLNIVIKKVLVSNDRNPDLVAKINYKKSSKERDGEWEVYGAISY